MHTATETREWKKSYERRELWFTWSIHVKDKVKEKCVARTQGEQSLSFLFNIKNS